MTKSAEIVCIGTELLLGHVVNTNASWLATQCAASGIDVYYQTVVGDRVSRIVDVLALAAQRAHIVICTGGLGPTMDDVSREALAAHTCTTLVVDPSAAMRLQEAAARSGRTVDESYYRQAHTLDGADVLQNDVGLAIGTALVHDGVRYVLLPGPPREMKAMFSNYALPWLAVDGVRLHSIMVRLTGIGEGDVARALEPLIRHQTDPTIATYAGIGDVLVRITTRADAQASMRCAPIVQTMTSLLGQYVYAMEDVSLPTVLVHRLTERMQTLAVAESCTGGAVAHAITSVPGSSRVLRGAIVAYTDACKQDVLGVSQDVLAQNGAVSDAAARELASCVRRRLGSDFGIATTGTLGPDDPVREAFVAVAHKGGCIVHHVPLVGTDRDTNKQRIAMAALACLWRHTT
ncbi:MAG: competence/damage-inducible protein A [Paenibacillaceae bacterium]|nr:competence/damage-inducible protein A [Paenibacillaceae bacterium]